jgi:ribosomal-protein-alanine N-acetyltransferase
MIHKSAVTLETERLTLRRFEESDAEAMFRNLYSDAEAMRFLPWEPHTNVTETQKRLADYIAGYSKTDFYAWAIVPNDLGEPIGFIDAATDETIDAFKVDYGIGKLWWHKGYTSNALSVLIHFFFHDIRANRVYATHDPRNPNSGAVMRKCGMRLEGILRQTRRRKGEYSDRAMYAILAEDYVQDASGRFRGGGKP